MSVFAKGKFTNRPKRKIRKRIFFGIHTAINALVTTVIDTMDEEETLVRIVGNISVKKLTAPGASDEVSLYIAKSSSGSLGFTTTSPNNVAHVGRDAKAVLWSQGIMTGLQNDVQNFDIDVKGQRKLAELDEIVVMSHGVTNNVATVAWSLTMFYKKA